MRSLTKLMLPLIGLFLCGCPDNPSAPAPPPIAQCGNLTAKVTGSVGGTAGHGINTTASVGDTGTKVTWEVPAGGSGTSMDGVQATGNIAAGGASPRHFTAKGNTGGNPSFTITVTGDITGPTGDPAKCTGSGDWTLTPDGGTQPVARGRWVIQ